MAIIADPVEAGLVNSLGQPGGNLTGLAFQNQVLTTKRLGLLTKASRPLLRVRLPWDSSGGGVAYTQVELAARTLPLRMQRLARRGPAHLESAFNAATAGRAEALLVLASPFLNANRKIVVDLAARRHPCRRHTKPRPSRRSAA